MRVVIVSNGSVSRAEFLLQLIKDDDTVICADGGANQAVAMGFVPKILVGDMDSIETSVLAELSSLGQTEIVRVPPEKNESDTELAMDAALALQPAEIVLTGVLGERIDHSLANIGLLARVPPSIECRIEEARETIILVRKEARIEGWPGRVVSLLPFGAQAHGVTLEGFKYPLVRGDLRQGMTLGLSNVMVSERASVKVSEGELVAVMLRGRP